MNQPSTKRFFATLVSLVLIFSLAAPLTAFASTAPTPDSVWARPELEITIDDSQIHRWTAIQFRNNETFFVDIRDVARTLGNYDLEFIRGDRWHWSRSTETWQWIAQDTYVIHSGISWTNSNTIRSNTSQQNSLTRRAVNLWHPVQAIWATRSAYEINSVANGGGLMVSVWDLPSYFPSIESVERLWEWNSSTQNWRNRFHITRVQPTPSGTVLARPELEVTIDNSNTIRRWTGAEFVPRTFDNAPWVNIRDVARTFGDYDIEFVRGGQQHWVSSLSEWRWFDHDTYIVHSGTTWSNSNTIRSDTGSQATLTNKSVRIFHPATNTWAWRQVYEINTTDHRGGIMIPIMDLRLFFPSVQTVAQGSIRGQMTMDWVWTRFHITRTQIVTPEPPIGTIFTQERPNNAHVTGTQLVAAIYHRFVGPNDSNNAMIQWAISNGLIDGRTQGDDFLTRVIVQPEIYGILAKHASVFGSNDSWAHRDDSRWTHVSIPSGLEWTRPAVNRAQDRDWFFTDYNQNRGLSLHDLNRLLNAAW